MKDKVQQVYSELLGLIPGLVPINKGFMLLIAVDEQGHAVIHEVNDLMYDTRRNQVVWFTQGIERYTKVKTALQTWGIESPMEEWLEQRVEILKAQNKKYDAANKALHIKVGQLELKSSRWRDEAIRLQESADEWTEKYYSAVSHGDS